MNYCQLYNYFVWIFLILICLLLLFILLNSWYKPCLQPDEQGKLQNDFIEQYSSKLNNPLYYLRPYVSSDLTAKVLYDQSHVVPLYKTSHINYSYIPMQEYFDEGMNLYTRPFPVWYSVANNNMSNPTLLHNEINTPDMLSNYVIRGPISERCFKEKIEETRDLRYSLAACDITMAQKMMTGKIIDNDNGFLPKNNTNP